MSADLALQLAPTPICPLCRQALVFVKTSGYGDCEPDVAEAVICHWCDWSGQAVRVQSTRPVVFRVSVPEDDGA